jgi:hypothetical protein
MMGPLKKKKIASEKKKHLQTLLTFNILMLKHYKQFFHSCGTDRILS